MSNYNNSRIPLHMQNQDIAKAAKENPSYESFRPNVIHGVQYKEMEDRAGINDQSRMRRYPNGELDYTWAMNTILDAVKRAEIGDFLAPIDMALLTVVFPVKYRKMEPQQADIMTKLSRTEKDRLAQLISMQIAEEMNWNTGLGGGSVSGRGRTVY